MPRHNPTELSRDDELDALDLLANQHKIGEYLADKRWRPLYGLACFIHSDAPVSLAVTDPAKYRALRRQITDARIAGWLQLNPESLFRLLH